MLAQGDRSGPEAAPASGAMTAPRQPQAAAQRLPVSEIKASQSKNTRRCHAISLCQHAQVTDLFEITARADAAFVSLLRGTLLAPRRAPGERWNHAPPRGTAGSCGE